MTNVDTITNQDLEYICKALNFEFTNLSGNNLLITGGAGFLGYYLIQSTLYWNTKKSSSSAIKITLLDNFIRGVPNWLTQLSNNPHLSIINHDITQPLPDNMDNFQYIIHAASIASPTYYRKYPIQTMDANVNGLRYLLDYSLEQKEFGAGPKGFLFYSTSEIYGDPPQEYIPTPEDFRGNVSCTGPRACYDESKRFGETLCVNYARQYELPITIARPFNNYGPGLKITDKRVIPDFARDILSGQNIVMFSNGSPTRTFCYTADAIIGYYKILTRGTPGHAYNIGVDSPEISIKDLAELLVKEARDLFGYKGSIINKTNPDQNYLTDNPNRRCPDISKARKELDYNPGISLEEGMHNSLIWYYYNQQAEEE